MDDMIIDIRERLVGISESYGLDKDEGEYLLELLILRLYDYSGDLCGLNLGGRLKSGIAFVDFVDRVRRGKYDRKKYLWNFRYNVNVFKIPTGDGRKYIRKKRKRLNLRSLVFYGRWIKNHKTLKKAFITRKVINNRKLF